MNLRHPPQLRQPTALSRAVHRLCIETVGPQKQPDDGGHDFGPKWAEAIGQALYYSLQTGKRAGVALILEKPKDHKYWIRLNSTIQHFGLPIDTWKMGE